jgi:hypothetical protein
MTTYSASSPYFNTQLNSMYLELLTIRPVPAESSDYLYILEQQYQYRPDLLSYDLYGDPNLWWVFTQRNMSVIKDPIYDFVTGICIYLPKKSNLIQYLGV